MTPCRLCRLYGRTPPADTTPRPHACPLCRDDFHTALTALATRDLTVDAIPERTGGGTGPRPPGPRIPVSIEHLTLIGPHSETAPAGPDQIPVAAHAPALDGWIAELAEWREEPAPRRWYSDRARWLLDRIDWLCDAYDSVGGLARDVESADRALARQSRTSTTRHPIGRCTRAYRGGICGEHLEASVWDPAVNCPRCAGRWPRRDWRNLATEMSKETPA